jgi:hypothetical protein
MSFLRTGVFRYREKVVRTDLGGYVVPHHNHTSLSLLRMTSVTSLPFAMGLPILKNLTSLFSAHWSDLFPKLHTYKKILLETNCPVPSSLLRQNLLSSKWYSSSFFIILHSSVDSWPPLACTHFLDMLQLFEFTHNWERWLCTGKISHTVNLAAPLLWHPSSLTVVIPVGPWWSRSAESLERF